MPAAPNQYTVATGTSPAWMTNYNQLGSTNGFISPSANVASTAVQAGAPQSQNNGIFQTLTNAKDAYNIGSKAVNLLGNGTGSGTLNSAGTFGNVTSATDTLGIAPSSYMPPGFSDSMQIGNVGATLEDGTSVASGVGESALGTIGETLGAAGFGAFGGNLIGKWLGLKQTGSTVGGAIGGAIGSAALGGLTTGLVGAGSSALIGAELGSFLPGIGTVIGAVGGALIGGLFGPGKPHPASNFAGAQISPTGQTSGAAYGSKHTGDSFAQGIEGDFSNYLQSQTRKYDIQYGNGVQVSGGYDPGVYGGGGYSYIVDTKDGKNAPKYFNFNGDDKDSRNQAQQDAFNYIATLSGYDPANLPEKQTAHATNIDIPTNNTPSQWQAFLDNYKQTHGL